MSSKIEWTGETWNPMTGCTKVSEGCKHCYAERMAKRLQMMGQEKYYDGFKPRFHPDALNIPLRWKKPRTVFVNSMSDMFHEDFTFTEIAAVFGMMGACPHHTFQVLTKRADRMEEFFHWVNNYAEKVEVHDSWNGRYDTGASFWVREIMMRTLPNNLEAQLMAMAACRRWPLPNVWLGTTVENQDNDWRIPHLLQCPAAVRFVSYEPALGPLDISQNLGCQWNGIGTCPFCGYEHGMIFPTQEDGPPKVDWVIAGGESGPGARPVDLQWLRDVRDQCKAAGVPFFMKQIDKKHPIPEDLMIREYPKQEG